MKQLAFLFSIIVLASGICLAQTSAFTYQGKLGSSGAPASGVYQFEFKLFNADLAGTQIGTTQTVVATVTGGAFSTRLDFGAAAFPGDVDRWLEISVRLNGAVEPYTILSPRQQINSVPFAVRSLNATNADIATNATNATTADSATTAGNVTGVVPVTNGGTGSATQNFVDLSTNQRRIAGDKEFAGAVSVTGAGGVFNGNGSGLTNLNGANLTDGSMPAAKFAAGAVFRWNVITTTELQAEANNGYVINRPNMEVSVNLPTSPQVGDFIRVESATEQGFRITQNSGQSITIGNGNLQNIAWTPRETERSWKSVASSADGAKLVAVSSHFDTFFGGTPGFIYTSTDSGVTWTPRESLRMWQSVASSADGTKLVAVVSPGQIYTSTDSGVTWTPRESNRGWASVVSSADGTRLVALAGRVFTSNDSGESWDGGQELFSCSSVASSADGAKLVGSCILNSGTPQAGIFTSSNAGSSWTFQKHFPVEQSVASSADGAKLVAAGFGGQIYISTDSGVTWTPREGNRQWVSVASSANGIKLVAAVKSGNIYTSTDSGITWIPQQGIRDWVSVASSADGTKLVAAADLDFIWVRDASVSTSGGTGGIIAGNSTSVELIYLGAGKFLILNQKGSIVFY
jgi:hypothetical protein